MRYLDDDKIELPEAAMNRSAAATQPAASSRQRFTLGEWMLLGVVALAVLHHVDHVLRADNSGWPFTPDVTPFTISLLVYPIFVLDFLLLRDRPWIRVGWWRSCSSPSR
jgi:hypothetical protein